MSNDISDSTIYTTLKHVVIWHTLRFRLEEGVHSGYGCGLSRLQDVFHGLVMSVTFRLSQFQLWRALVVQGV